MGDDLRRLHRGGRLGHEPLVLVGADAGPSGPQPDLTSFESAVLVGIQLPIGIGER